MRNGTGWYRLDENGEPHECYTHDEYHSWRKSEAGEKAWRVAEDFVNGVRISTVFLGLDHSYEGRGGPILWESMTFGGEAWGVEQVCDRYRSLDEARAGHATIVEKAKGYPRPDLDAVLKRLHAIETCLQHIKSSLWAFCATCKDRPETINPTGADEWLRPLEEWAGKLLKTTLGHEDNDTESDDAD